MANDFYQDGTQVVYGVHEKSGGEEGQNVHVHFAINTVDYRTGKKRRENKTQTKERTEQLKKIVQENIRMASESLKKQEGVK